MDEKRRLSFDKYKERENAQISRIFRLKDPNVDVIYITPFVLSADVTRYYAKILELCEVPDASERLHLVFPENTPHFSKHMSLTRCLLYSPKACKQITTLIADKQAYIVPGKQSQDEVKLSIVLGVPIFCGDPLKTLMFNQKSFSKRVF